MISPPRNNEGKLFGPPSPTRGGHPDHPDHYFSLF
jgi:hypothetical protein